MSGHAEMLAELEAACRARELLYVIMPPMRRAGGCAGFPDAIVAGTARAGATRVLAIEVKTESGEVHPEQQLWAWALERTLWECSIECEGPHSLYALWRDGEPLERLLKGLGPVPGAKLLYR